MTPTTAGILLPNFGDKTSRTLMVSAGYISLQCGEMNFSLFFLELSVPPFFFPSLLFLSPCFFPLFFGGVGVIDISNNQICSTPP